jgi:ABC-type dipeptide/oligopeptide/nickel transport system ATPase subunit
MSLLEIDNLHVRLPTPRGDVHAVAGVSLSLKPGVALGIVGESGSGKTMLSRAVLRLLPRTAQVTGRIGFGGRDVRALEAKALRAMRGREMAVVFQDPMTSLNPVLTVGTQITETLHEHFGTPRGAAMARACALLGSVGIPEPEKRLRQFPHELSGGMRQRVAIAIALACEPKLLFADEPTSHRSGANPRPARRRAGTPPDGAGADHARPGRGGGPHRGAAGDVCRPHHGTRPHARGVQADAPPVHTSAARGDPAARPPAARAAGGDRRHAARPDEPAAGLRVRAAVPACRSRLPRGA